MPSETSIGLCPKQTTKGIPLNDRNQAQALTDSGSHLIHTPPVSAVDNVNERVSLVEVVAPVRPNGLLPPDIPNVQLEVLVHEALDIEALPNHRM